MEKLYRSYPNYFLPLLKSCLYQMAPAIRNYREKLSLSEQEAANALQISVEKYIGMESGDSHFSLEQLKMLWNWLTPKMKIANITPVDYLHWLETQ